MFPCVPFLLKIISYFSASDFMDDGTKIQLKVSIDPAEGSATFDFTGTGYEVWGNCNAPRAITVSAIIYCLRCLVGRDIPLNQVWDLICMLILHTKLLNNTSLFFQGCMTPITMIVPKGTILAPSDDAGE